MKQVRFHPLSELFPILPTNEMQDLVNSIKDNGLQQKIILFEGKILDGRHRYEACQIADVKPKFDLYRGDDPCGFVLRANIQRRHLTPSQRAMLAAKVADLKQGSQGQNNLQKSQQTPKTAKFPSPQKPTHEQAAKAAGVSARSVDDASKVLDADKKLAESVAKGDISVSKAAKEVRKQEQTEKQVHRDETGWPIPADLIETWERRSEVTTMMANVTTIATKLKAYQKSDDPIFCAVNFSSAVSKLEFAHMEIRAAELHAVCTTCQGRARAKCTHCKGRGFLSKAHWQLVPEKIKDIRKKAAK